MTELQTDKTTKLKPEARRDGQIVPRGENKHLVRVSLGTDKNTGARRYHNKTVYGSKADARKYLNKVLRDVHLGEFVEPSRETLNQYLDHWLKTAAKPRLRSRTFEDYEALLTRYIREPLGEKKLIQIRPLDIQTVYADMLERGLSARVVRYAHAVLSSALKQAVRWNMLRVNPASAVDLPKNQRKEMLALDAQEASRFLAACNGEPHALVLAFALGTGMRPEEYCALKWSDVDLTEGRATVQRALVWFRKGGGWEFQEPKTRQSRRTIPLPASLVSALRQYKHEQAAQRAELGTDYEKHDLVFCSQTGSPLAIRNLGVRYFKPVLRKAGLSDQVRLYDLRHTHATLLLLAGENPKVVSERLGHSGIQQTMDTYSHVLPNMQRAAADKIEGLLFAQPFQSTPLALSQGE